MTRQGDDPAAARERAQERLAAAVATLEAGIAALLDGEGFARYLRTMARFHQYSARNVALIHAQRPAATRVAGYRAWQALGRQVRQGERGIVILAPRRVKLTGEAGGEEVWGVRGFGVAHVFDVAQTAGADLPAPPTVAPLASASDAGARLWDRLAAFLAGAGVTVAREDTGAANGVYYPLRRHIAVHPRLTGDQAAKTLAHEAAHHVAAHGGGVPRADAETVAEGAAYVVLHHCGVDAGGYTFPYVARWAEDWAVLARNLEAIRATASALIVALEGAPAGRAAA